MEEEDCVKEVLLDGMFDGFICRHFYLTDDSAYKMVDWRGECKLMDDEKCRIGDQPECGEYTDACCCSKLSKHILFLEAERERLIAIGKGQATTISHLKEEVESLKERGANCTYSSFADALEGQRIRRNKQMEGVQANEQAQAGRQREHVNGEGRGEAGGGVGCR